MNELKLKKNGDVEILDGRIPTPDNLEELEQRIFIKLNHWQGEYFLNKEGGTRWLEILGNKDFEKDFLFYLRQSILDVVGVSSIKNLDYTIHTRYFNIDLTIVTVFNVDLNINTNIGI